MTGMTGWNLCINYTSVEGIQRGGVKNIAFLISRSQQGSQQSTPSEVKQQTPEDWPVLCTVQRSSERTYVVMQTKPLEHPWYTDLMSGFRDTMGDRVIDWFNPFKLSPCKQKTHQGEFQWGGVVYDMAKKYEEDNPGTQLAILH
jgi:palmitoyltransferase